MDVKKTVLFAQGNGEVNRNILDTEYINDPISAIKKHWNSLPDGVYTLKLGCGSDYAALVLHSTGGTYGAVCFISYAQVPQITLTCTNGIWNQ